MIQTKADNSILLLKHITHVFLIHMFIPIAFVFRNCLWFCQLPGVVLGANQFLQVDTGLGSYGKGQENVKFQATIFGCHGRSMNY